MTAALQVAQVVVGGKPGLAYSVSPWEHSFAAKALSDGPNAWPLDRMASLLSTLVELDLAVKKKPFEESLL